MRNLTPEDLKHSEEMIEGAVTEDRLPCWVHKPSARHTDGLVNTTSDFIGLGMLLLGTIFGALAVAGILALTGHVR